MVHQSSFSLCNEIYNTITLRFKFGFIFQNYKFYYLWNQEMVSHLLTAVTAYHSKPYNSSYLEYFRLSRVAWPEEFISCYFVSINVTDFGYWTYSLNTHQDDYTTRVPAVAYHQNYIYEEYNYLCTNIIKIYWVMISFILLIFKGKTY